MAEITFYCTHCGRKLAVDLRAAGKVVLCPDCCYELDVPTISEPTRVDARKSTRRIRVPVDDMDERVAGKRDLAVEYEVREMEMIVGWMCLALGIVFLVVLPKFPAIYIALFLGSLIAGFMLMMQGRGAQGLLMATCALLLPALIGWYHFKGRDMLVEGPVTQEHGRVTKLVFKEGSDEPVLVDTEAEVALAPKEETPDERTRRLEAKALKMGDVSPAPPRPVRSGPAPQPKESSEKEEMFQRLLANREPKPTLVPETVNPATGEAEPRIFYWQSPATSRPAAYVAAPPLVDMPFPIYTECSASEQPYTPSGWMGNLDAIEMDECWEVRPRSGQTCIKAEYGETHFWGGIAWQDPPNNWGVDPGGYDLSNAKKLSVWAKTDMNAPATYVAFKVGLKSREPYRDTIAVGTGRIKLSSRWKKYTIDLEGYDLSRIISGFVWVVEAADTPVVFYIDDVVFE